MNSAQESKNELEAAIRYAENAISSAKGTIESLEFRQQMAQKNYQEQTGREEALQTQVALLEERIKTMEYDLTAKTAQAEAWKKEARELNERNDSLSATIQRLKQDQPTMPVIPKDVAIAIFREGLVYGASNVCDELDNASDIEVSDRECMGNFEVEYTQYVELSDHLDLDFLRSKAVDNADEEWVVDCLNSLCADNKFECRIHGVDDEAKDSASA